MSNLVWVEITPDFDPVAYMEAYGDEPEAVEVLKEANEEEQLLHLYEWGYLSKRDGKMKYLFPEEDLDEGDYSERVKKAYKMSREKGGKGVTGGLHAAGKAAWRGLGSKGQKIAMAGTGGVGAALAARALYKKMKKKQAQKESLDDFDEQDWAELVNDGTELGFDFNDWDELGEALEFGEYIDSVLLDAEEQGLSEDYSEEDIVEVALEEADKKKWEKVKGMMGQAAAPVQAAAGRAKEAFGKGYSRASAQGAGKAAAAVRGAKGARRAVWHGMGKAGKVGVGAAGAVGAGLAARALYRKMKQRRAARRARQEELNSFDLDHLLTDAVEMGFELDGYEELLDALTIGEHIDTSVEEASDGLIEDLSDEEIVEAVLYDMDEAVKDWLKGKAKEAAVRVGKLGAPTRTIRGEKVWMKGPEEFKKIGAKRLAGAAAGLGAAALARKALKKRKTKKEKAESLEYTGYRSSAEGGVFESAPIPFGTGNRLYDKNLVEGILEAFPQEAARLKKALDG
jgi:hypothetical protein